MKQIGLIGIGKMGSLLLQQLIKSNYKVIIFDLNTEVYDDYHNNTIIAKSAKEVIENSDITILMLPNDDSVISILIEENFHKSSKKKYILDLSTISPNVSKNCYEKLLPQNIYYYDCPVSGGQKGAQEAQLTIMVGGEKDYFNGIESFLSIFGKNIIYCGQAGMGQKVKAINQLILAINLISISEGITLAKSNNVNTDVLTKVIESSSASSWAFTNKKNNILENKHSPGFTLDLHIKDLNIALDMNTDNLDLPSSYLTRRIMNNVLLMGKGDNDHSIVYHYYQ